MISEKEKLERLTCTKLAAILKKNYSLNEVRARYDRAYTRYRSMILCENREYISPTFILDDVAYVNALARYAASRGLFLKEIR